MIDYRSLPVADSFQEQQRIDGLFHIAITRVVPGLLTEMYKGVAQRSVGELNQPLVRTVQLLDQKE